MSKMMETKMENNWGSICGINHGKIKNTVIHHGNDGPAEIGVRFFDALPLSRDDFVGRKSELAWLERNLLGDDQGQRGGSTVVIAGTGGMGKTQLALRFAKMYQSHYGSIVFLDATTQTTMTQSLYTLAETLQEVSSAYRMSAGEEQKTAAVMLSKARSWLSADHKVGILVIADNYDDPSGFPGFHSDTGYDLRDFLSLGGRCTTIISSRAHIDRLGPCLSLLRLSDTKDQLSVLLSRAGRNATAIRAGRHCAADDLKDASALVERLDGLPLGLVTAGTYLRQFPDVTFREYLEAYNLQWTKLADDVDCIPEYSNSSAQKRRVLFATWDVTLEQVSRISTEAVKFLSFLAYLSPKAVRFDLFASCPEPVPEWFRAVRDDRREFHRRAKLLSDYSLLEVNHAAKAYSLHPCLHDWLSASMEKPDPDLLDLACATVSAEIQATAAPDWAVDASVISHLSSLGRKIQHSSEFSEFPHRSTINFRRLVHLAQQREDFETAQTFLQVLLAQQEQNVGNDHPDTWMAMHDSANLLLEMKKLSEAEILYRLILDKSDKATNAHASLRPAAQVNLGRTLHEQNKLKEAEILYLELIEQSKSPADARVAMDGLGLVYGDQGRHAEAEKLHRRAHEIAIVELGPEHPHTVTALHNLALSIRAQGSLDDAIALFKQCLELRSSTIGKERSPYLTSLLGLGEAYRMKGQLEEAQSTLDSAFHGLQRIVPWSHRACVAYLALVRTQTAQGKGDEALPRFKTLLQKLECDKSDEHPMMLICLREFAACCRQQKKFDQAEELLRRRLEGSRKAFGESSPKFLEAQHDMGTLEQSRGRLEKAEELLERVVVDRSRLLGEHQQDTIDSLYCLAEVHLERGKLTKAETSFRVVLEAEIKTQGWQNAAPLETANELAYVLASLGKLTEAATMYERVLCLRETVLGSAHFRTLITANDLGLVRMRQGRYSEATFLLHRAMQAQFPLSRITSTKNLAQVLCELGKIEEASECCQIALNEAKDAFPLRTFLHERLNRTQGQIAFAQQRYDQACAKLEQASDAYTKKHGPDHFETLSVLSELAAARHRQGDVKTASDILAHVLQAQEHLFGSEHFFTLSTSLRLGHLYTDIDKHADAENLLLRVLQGRKKAYGPTHRETIETYQRLGDLYLKLSRLRESQIMYKEALEGLRSVVGPHHALTLNCQQSLHRIEQEKSNAGWRRRLAKLRLT